MRMMLLMLGEAGCRVAERVIHAAAAGLLSADPDGIDLLCAVERGTDPASAATLHKSYARVRELLQSIAPIRFGVMEAEPLGAECPADDPLQAALFSAAEPDAALLPRWAVEWHRLLRAEPFTGLLTEQETEYRAILCGDMSDPFSAAAMAVLPEKLRANGCAGADALLLLTGHSDAERAAVQYLRRLGEIPDAVLMGIPEDCRGGDTAWFDWLAACAVTEMAGAAERSGWSAWAMPSDRIGWSAFGDREEEMRAACGRMVKAAALMGTSLLPDVLRRLHHPSMTDRAVGWYAPFAARCRQQPGTEEQTEEDLRAVMSVWRAAAKGLLTAAESLPERLRGGADYLAAQEKCAAGYRRLLDSIGRLGPMRDEIEASGMADENPVQRGKREETDVERLLREARELGEKTEALREEQKTLERAAGGVFVMRLQQRMLRGIELAIRTEKDGIAGYRAAADNEKLPEEERQEQRSAAFRLENHVQELQHQQKAVTEDMERAEREQYCALPPETASSAEPLVRVEMLRAALSEAGNRRSAAATLDSIGSLVIGDTDSANGNEMLSRIAHDESYRRKGDGQPAAAALARAILNAVWKEAEQ